MWEKVVSFPPLQLTRPGSDQTRCSRLAPEGLADFPLTMMGRTPDQVEMTSARPGGLSEYNGRAARSR